MILIFVSITKKIEVDRNGCEYILLRIVVYFTEYLLAVEIDEKKLVERDLIFEEKWQKALKVINLFELIRVKKGMIQTMKLVEHKYLSINLKTDNQTNETKYQKK